MQSKPVRSINASNIGNRFCLQRLVSVVKFISERGLVFRDDEDVGSSRDFSKRFSKLFSRKDKKRCLDASGDRFCNSIINR